MTDVEGLRKAARRIFWEAKKLEDVEAKDNGRFAFAYACGEMFVLGHALAILVELFENVVSARAGEELSPLDLQTMAQITVGWDSLLSHLQGLDEVVEAELCRHPVYKQVLGRANQIADRAMALSGAYWADWSSREQATGIDCREFRRRGLGISDARAIRCKSGLSDG